MVATRDEARRAARPSARVPERREGKGGGSAKPKRARGSSPDSADIAAPRRPRRTRARDDSDERRLRQSATSCDLSLK